MTEPPVGRHRAPEPSPSTGGGFAVWAAFLVVVIAISFLVGLATGAQAAWGTFAITLTVLILSVAINHVTPGSPTVSPRAKREAAYVGRTAERATIWWAVFRALNGIFR